MKMMMTMMKVNIMRIEIMLMIKIMMVMIMKKNRETKEEKELEKDEEDEDEDGEDEDEDEEDEDEEDLADVHDGLRVIGVDVEDRSTDDPGHVSAVGRGAREAGIGGEADLVDGGGGWMEYSFLLSLWNSNFLFF